MIWKGCGRRQSWLCSRYFSGMGNSTANRTAKSTNFNYVNFCVLLCHKEKQIGTKFMSSMCTFSMIQG